VVVDVLHLTDTRKTFDRNPDSALFVGDLVRYFGKHFPIAYYCFSPNCKVCKRPYEAAAIDGQNGIGDVFGM